MFDRFSSPSTARLRRAPYWKAAAFVAIAGLAASALTLHASEHGTAAPAAAGTPPVGVSLADIIERVQPSVVSIAVSRSVGGGMPVARQFPSPDAPAFQGTPFDDMLRRFFEMTPEGGRTQQKAQALGTGFVIDADGYVVTNNHVVEGADEITVTLADGTQYTAKVQGRDPATDLALLKVEPKQPLVAVPFGDSDRARVGEWVVAVGNPFGLGGTATAGIISARGRDIRSGPFDDYLQIDAPINMGNSGGPVFDMQGQVIGINTAIFSPNGGSVGIGFAIPAALAQPVLAQLREGGAVQRGWLGVEIQELDREAAESLGLDPPRGALVAGIAPASPAAKAGLRVGDVIVAFDGKPVERLKDLTRRVAQKGDEEVSMEVWRDGHSETLEAHIASKDGDSARLAFEPGAPTEGNVDGGIGEVGLALAPLSAQARARFDLADAARGAVIVGVRPGSQAAEQGLRPGDVIEMVGQEPVTEPQQVAAAVKDAGARGRKSVLVLVRRGDDKRFVTLGLG